MLVNRLLLALCSIGLVVTLALPAFAEDTPARPRLENYANYNEFLAAMYAYKKQLELEKKFADSIMINIQTADAPAKVSTMPVKSPEMDSTIDIYVPPLIITGPESLEMAIEAAKKFMHPVYHEPLRYNRTTAQSFPLKPLEVNSLEEAAITDSFRLDSSPDPELQVANSLAAKAPALKLNSAEEQSDQMSDASLNVLRKADSFFGNSITIISADVNQVNISAINR